MQRINRIIEIHAVRTQLQKGGVVYSHMIDRDLAAAGDLIQAWESLDLTVDQKLYRLIFTYNVLFVLLLRTKQRKKDVDQIAINTLERMTRRKNKKKKKQEILIITVKSM